MTIRNDTTPHVDWRADAAPDDLREYDRFGPWIDVVRSVDDMPKFFRDHYDEHRDARFLLKIPKRIDRAQARPGMHLFAAVLAVHDDLVCLLRAEDTAVARVEAAISEVVAISCHSTLLVSRWELLLRDGNSLEFGFNSMGLERIGELTDFIRIRNSAGYGQLEAEPTDIPADQDFFRSSLLTLRQSAQQPVVPLHLENPNRLCRDHQGRRSLTNGLMLASTPSDLIVVSRGDTLRPWYRRPTYTSGTMFLPYAQMDGYRLDRPQRHDQPHQLVITAGKQEISLWCSQGPDSAVQALKSRSVPQL